MAADFAAQLESIAELEARGGPDDFPSTAAFVASALRLSLREARERIALACQELPLARSALSEGNLSPRHFVEIARLLAHAPDWLPSETATATEQALVTVAGQASVETVRKWPGG
jgi:hypothetical protein